jgi:hypothetical protein
MAVAYYGGTPFQPPPLPEEVYAIVRDMQATVAMNSLKCQALTALQKETLQDAVARVVLERDTEILRLRQENEQVLRTLSPAVETGRWIVAPVI